MVDATHAHHLAVGLAISELRKQELDVYISWQSLYEFLAVATRLPANQGLGWIQSQAVAGLNQVRSSVIVLFDTPLIANRLTEIVQAYSVVGKSVHDARLVATIDVAKINTILTINAKDFRRYHNITVIDPLSNS